MEQSKLFVILSFSSYQEFVIYLSLPLSLRFNIIEKEMNRDRDDIENQDMFRKERLIFHFA